MRNKNISFLIFISMATNACAMPAEPGKEQLNNTEQGRKLDSSFTENKVVKELWESSKIIGGAILAAVTYGIGNDQITVRVCPEYFTEGFHKNMLLRGASMGIKLHQHMLTETDPTKIGLFWGVAATWWVGAALGAPVALASRAGSWPKLDMGDLAKPVGIGVASLYGVAAAAGGYGYLASKNGWLSDNLKQNLKHIAGSTPQEAMHAYTADAFAHNAAYAGGALIGAGIITWALVERYRRAQDVEIKKAQQSSPLRTELYVNPFEASIGIKCTVEV